MTTKRAKSILANFGAFSEPASIKDVEGTGSQEASPPLPRVGAGVIGATQRSLNELRLERNRLQALVDAGGVLELDPRSVDPSPFPDRLQDVDDADFSTFKKRFAEEGQKLPIAVRRHPSAEGRYQIVYGHRRHRAAAELGINIRAVLSDLSDTELVVVQGIENSARLDLSWIERALFAWRMGEAAIKTRDIRAALSIDDPELARMRSVLRIIPVDVIEAIGPAGKIGRPRWIALARAMEGDLTAVDRVRKTLSADKVVTQPSDQRFHLAFSTANSQAEGKKAAIRMIKTPSGKTFGKVLYTGAGVQLKIPKSHAVAFAEFMEGELPELMKKFFAREGEG